MGAAILYFSVYSIYAVVNPYMPVLLKGLGYGPSVVGIIMGIFEVAGICGPFIFSYFSDRWGRYKPSLTIAYLIIIVAVFPLAGIHHVLFSIAAITLIAMGVKSAPSLLDAVVTLQLEKTGNYGKVRTAGSLGFMLFALFMHWAPFLRPDTTWNIAFWIAVTSIFALISMILFLKEDNPADEPRPAAYDENRTIPVGKTWNPVFLMGIAMIAFGRFALSPVMTFLSLYVVEELQSQAIGLIWAVGSMAEMPMMYFSRKLINRFGAFNLLAVSSAAVGLRLACYILIPNLTGVVLGQLLHSLCFGIFHPSVVRFITDYVPPERRATGMSIYVSIGTGLPTFLGNTLGGFIVERFGYHFLFASFIPFAAISVIMYFIIRPYVNKPVVR